MEAGMTAKIGPGERSVQIVIPDERHRRMKALAAINGRTISDEINHALERWLTENEPGRTRPVRSTR
jgi:hypothetical protein